MSQPNHGTIIQESYDWYHQDILDNPPFDDYEMVMALTDGRFLIEGKQSTIDDAWNYVEHRDNEEVWKAWAVVDNTEEWQKYLALESPIISNERVW